MNFLIIALVACVITCSYCLTNPPITGPTPPPVNCPDSLCSGKADGNYNYVSGYGYGYGGTKDNYFVQCVDGKASCQACWPLTMKFSQRCNQCVYSLSDPCYTTKSWIPETRYNCPDICPRKGPQFSGNIRDPQQPKQYVGCWEGITVGCVNCPGGLLFNEQWNACLYQGKYKTMPL